MQSFWRGVFELVLRKDLTEPEPYWFRYAVQKEQIMSNAMLCEHSQPLRVQASTGCGEVGEKNSVMQCSSDEPKLLQEAMQCQLTCEVVSSKTYVKKKHDTFYCKLPLQLNKTRQAMQSF